ncbi:MAG: DUF4861 family protein, partial [Flavobacteriales bacterium]|nr:DUF4861 family protein [Flavobacteriales bacterium]
DGNSPITHTFYTDLKEGNRLTYRFAMGWELTDDAFKTAKGFEGMLVSEASKLDSPIVVTKE